MVPHVCGRCWNRPSLFQKQKLCNVDLVVNWQCMLLAFRSSIRRHSKSGEVQLAWWVFRYLRDRPEAVHWLVFQLTDYLGFICFVCLCLFFQLVNWSCQGFSLMFHRCLQLTSSVLNWRDLDDWDSTQTPFTHYDIINSLPASPLRVAISSKALEMCIHNVFVHPFRVLLSATGETHLLGLLWNRR